MLDAATRAAMDEALDDEHKARATYRAILDRHGPVSPFVNIVASEGRHIAALSRLYAAHGLTPPADAWAGTVDAPYDLAEACAAGVAAEIENAAMYDRLLAQVTDPDVARVLGRLQEASAERHLPAFQRCVDRGGRSGRGGGGRGRARGGGRGRGRGRGRGGGCCG